MRLQAVELCDLDLIALPIQSGTTVAASEM